MTDPAPVRATPAVELVVGSDAAEVGRTVRAAIDGGTRVAGFVGDPDDVDDAAALAELTADVLEPRTA